MEPKSNTPRGKELENETQECMIETEQEIRARERKATERSLKRTLEQAHLQETNHQGKNQNRKREIRNAFRGKQKPNKR